MMNDQAARNTHGASNMIIVFILSTQGIRIPTDIAKADTQIGSNKAEIETDRQTRRLRNTHSVMHRQVVAGADRQTRRLRNTHSVMHRQVVAGADRQRRTSRCDLSGCWFCAREMQMPRDSRKLK